MAKTARREKPGKKLMSQSLGSREWELEMQGSGDRSHDTPRGNPHRLERVLRDERLSCD